ncbi:MAG: hypothetical protein R3C14_09725 [Caldilineaceae bacterium]
MKAQPSVEAVMNHAAEAPTSHSKPLVGAWFAEASSRHHDYLFPVLLTFTSDGIVFGNKPPSSFESMAHGNWVSTGHATTAFTFRVLFGSEDGSLSKSLKVMGTLRYDAKSDTIEGSWSVYRDAEKVVDQTNFHGARIVVES